MRTSQTRTVVFDSKPLTLWGTNGAWKVGAHGGMGLGGPVFPAVEKVGAIHRYQFAGVFYRVRPGAPRMWFEANAGGRWGERHEYFGSDANGMAIPDTFHGEPVLTERSLIQGYASLGIRMSFR